MIVLIGHFIWMALLYVLAGIYSHENPMDVVRYYGPAYLTAVGTMSSAATLAVALQCAGKAKPLRKDMVQFGIPLFANIHLCGSVLTEVFFCMTISRILYGSLPSVGTMILFLSSSGRICHRCSRCPPEERLWHPLVSSPACLDLMKPALP